MKQAYIVLLFCLGCFAADSVKFTKNEPLSIYWDLINSNGDSELQLNEIQDYLDEGESTVLDINEVEHYFRYLDVDNDGHVTKEEFYSRYGYLRDEIQNEDPQQIHLALTGNNTEMIIMWITFEKVDPVVQWGTESGVYVNKVFGTTTTYSVGLGGWNGFIHKARLRSLQEDSNYFYRVGDVQKGWSTERNFKTIKSTPHPTTIAIYGDMGVLPYGFSVTSGILRDMNKTMYDALVHLGDISYASDGKVIEIQALWDLFGRQIDPVSSIIPYMTVVGNHDAYNNFTAFTHRFHMPSERSSGFSNHWWSIDIGYAHFTMISSEHEYQPGSPQYKWIEYDLRKANANRKNVPWIFVCAHKPIYSSVRLRYDSHRPGAPIQKHLEPLLQKYYVDIMFAGHEHCYERTYPTLNGNPDAMKNKNVYDRPKHTFWVVQGSAGALVTTDWLEPTPNWSLERLSVYGFGRLNIYNSTALYYEFINTDDDEVADSFWVLKE